MHCDWLHVFDFVGQLQWLGLRSCRFHVGAGAFGAWLCLWEITRVFGKNNLVPTVTASFDVLEAGDKVEGYPRPPKRELRLEQPGNARPRRSAARAAKRAERREQAEFRLQQLTCKMVKVLRWKRRQEVWTAWMRDKTASAPAPSLAQPAAPAPAPAAPPPPAPSSPDVRMCSPCGSAEKRMHTPDSRASQTPATPPERAQDEKAQAGGRRRSPRRRRHTAGPHRHLRSHPRPTRSLIAQSYPTAPSTHLAAVRLLARPTHAYRPWAGNKHPRLGTRVPATPGLVSTQPIAGVEDIWPGSSRLSVFQARLC